MQQKGRHLVRSGSGSCIRRRKEACFCRCNRSCRHFGMTGVWHTSCRRRFYNIKGRTAVRIDYGCLSAFDFPAVLRAPERRPIPFRLQCFGVFRGQPPTLMADISATHPKCRFVCGNKAARRPYSFPQRGAPRPLQPDSGSYHGRPPRRLGLKGSPESPA